MKIFIGCPSYDGRVDFQMVHSIMRASKTITHSVNFASTSLLAFTFNKLWCDALNAKHNAGFTHFLMVHADVAPELWFADKMMSIMEEEKAAILSVVLPIKNGRGLTSTAMDTSEWTPARFTMKQIAALPETFSHPRLLVNTGLLLVDLRRPWVYDVYFTINDKIERLENGKYVQRAQPEDWQFSRMARKANAGKICATRAVKALHIGTNEFGNQGTWGEWEIDKQNGEAKLEE